MAQQAEDFGLYADRPFTIGVGDEKPLTLYDEREGVVRKGRKAWQVCDRQLEERRTTTQVSQDTIWEEG